MYYKFIIESEESGKTLVSGTAEDIGMLDFIHAVTSLIHSFEMDEEETRMLLIGVGLTLLHGKGHVTKIDLKEALKQMGEVDDED